MLPYKGVTKSDNIAVNLSVMVENVRETLLSPSIDQATLTNDE